MSIMLRAIAWVRRNGLIALTLVLAVLTIWWSILFYRFVDEVLSIAQRGYFFAGPLDKDALKNRLKREARERLQKDLQ
jgi:hypothetical protein